MTAPTYRLNSNGDYWQAAWTDTRGRRHRRSIGTKKQLNRKQALALVQQMAVEHGVNPALKSSDRGRLHDWCDRYLKVRSASLDDATVKSQRRTVDLLQKFFGNVTIDDVSRSDATDWRSSLAGEGLAESTICKHVRTAKVIMNHAVSEQVAGANPFSHLVGTAPTPERWDRTMVSLQDVEAVAATCPLAGRLALVGYFSGLRTSEAVHLRWDHVEGDRLVVEPRGGKRTTKQRMRVVRVEPGLRSAFEQWERRTITACGVLEANQASSTHRLMQSACDRAGVDRFTMQDLRRTRDTIWHGSVPSHVACAWMGHSERVAREHYLSIPENYYRHEVAV